MPEDKPKKTLTEEQKQKMLEGRKKAHLKRQLEKNALKDKIKKEKELQKEAIQQQRDLLASQELDREQKRAVRNKLKELKQPPSATLPTPASEAGEEIVSEATEAVEEVAEKVQEVLAEIEQPLPKSPSEPIPPVITDEMYEKEFKKQSKVIEKTLPKEVQKLFKQTTNKFNFNLSLEENINGMIEHVKKVVSVNAQTASAVRERQKLQEAKRLEEELIVSKRLEDEKSSQRIDDQLQSLFNLR